MRTASLFIACCVTASLPGAEVESRVLTHYVPQDFLETMVRTEAWTELKLDVKGGLRKGDVVRVWTGGSIDYGNGDQPGENITTPAGLPRPQAAGHEQELALSQQTQHAFLILVKTEGKELRVCKPAGKALEITLTKDQEHLWLGFNDLRGRYLDNHLGKGRRHELDPMWMRIEVVRTIVD
jgi:hypothetical protein